MVIILVYSIAIGIAKRLNIIPMIGKSIIFRGSYWVTYEPIAIPKKRELRNLYLIKALLFILSCVDTAFYKVSNMLIDVL